MVFPPSWPPNDPYGYRPQVPPPPPFQAPFAYGQQQQPNRQHLLNQLRKPDGTWDYEKIINHGGQIVSIVNQARPLVKQMGPLLSLFKK